MELFVGDPDAPLQVVRVGYTGDPVAVMITGDGLRSDPVTATAADGVLEVPVRVKDPVPGQRRAARVQAGTAEFDFEFTVAEPGWTMHMISHFHYDPVWWNTQEIGRAHV